MLKNFYTPIERCKIAKDFIFYNCNPCEVINGFWDLGNIIVVFKKEGKLKQTFLYVDNKGTVKDSIESVYTRIKDVD